VNCRSCSSRDLTLVLSLGMQPLANALVVDPGAPEERFPLDLVTCSRCSLLQITETVPPEKLFREYPYFSSTSDAMVEHAKAITDRMGSPDYVIEIASNDGYLLQHYAARGIRVLGIEPARNIAKVAEARGIPTVSEFFGAGLAKLLQQPDVIHANNVLAHVPDLNGFVEGIAILLKSDGLAVIEVPYADTGLAFDTIYHEHLCYFSLTALDHLMTRHGLVITDVERLAIHGGSLRIFVSKNGERGSRVLELLAAETFDYSGMSRRVEALKKGLVRVVDGLRRDGKTVAAYGAAAKGSTLLNYCGIVPDFVADRSPHKQGRYMPGVHAPIVAADELVRRQPDACLLLTWNFADEIRAQQREYRGEFIIPTSEAA
jgi:SAM-dependent methyltransferase